MYARWRDQPFVSKISGIGRRASSLCPSIARFARSQLGSRSKDFIGNHESSLRSEVICYTDLKSGLSGQRLPLQREDSRQSLGLMVFGLSYNIGLQYKLRLSVLVYRILIQLSKVLCKENLTSSIRLVRKS
jgi:hypothetical protein